MTIKVLIADDHGVVRQGLTMYLGLDPELEVIGEAANGEEAVNMASDLEPARPMAPGCIRSSGTANSPTRVSTALTGGLSNRFCRRPRKSRR